MKTDEALGKTGAGPEGLPHSIIVTGEGVEGEIELASQVEADAVATVSAAQTDMLDKEQPVGPRSKGTSRAASSKERASKGKTPQGFKGKTMQMALFERPEKSDKRKRRNKSVVGSRPRGKK
jgi:DNA topoisomerase-6 subunit B